MKIGKLPCLILCFLMCWASLLTWGQTSPPSVQEFAKKLIEASSPQAQQSLLTANPGFINQSLAQALIAAGRSLPDRAQAIRVYTLAAEVASQAKASVEIAQAYNSMGVAYSNLGNYDAALAAFEKSLQIRRTLPNPFEVAKTLNNIAAMHEYKGFYDRSLVANEESLRIKQQLLAQTPEDTDLQRSIATSLVNLGLTHKILGNLSLASQYYGQSLKLFQSLRDNASAARTLNNLGVVDFEQGNTARALAHYDQALKQNSEAAKPDLEQKAQILNNIGLVHLSQKNYALALDACRESLRIRETLPNEEKIARSKRHLAMIYLEQKSYDEALKYGAEVAALSAEKQPENYWIARNLMGQAHLANHRLTEAQPHFEAAIQVIEKLRNQTSASAEIKQRFFENKVSPYLAMVEILIAQSRWSEALVYAERTKARTLLDLISTRKIDPALTESASTQPITLAETNALLATPHTALLEFVIANEKTYLFALEQTATTPALRVFPLAITKADLTKLVVQLRAELAGRKIGFTTSAVALYQQLLQPAQDVLRGKKSLVIVPDGILWEVPFQALMPARGRYLLEDYTISYAPSLTSLRELAQRHQAARSNTELLLALGNPLLSPEAFGGTAPPALLNAEKQLRALRQLYRSTKNDIYFGADASEECFKADAGKYSIIHLATHGIFDDQNPMASRVLLAKTEQEDGRLEAQEIMRLKLNANLVVLSACETARGRIGPGEGVIGLTWAFLNAGSPTVIVSQWEVREDATAELMKMFYSQIKTPTLGRADALRQAALSVMKNNRYRHPFYWAGFVLIGNGA